MAKPLRVGVIGTGFGARVHIPVFQRHPGAAVVAVCSAHLPRARAAARQQRIPAAFDDYRQMLAECDLDIVSVCSPPDLHAPMALAALRAGAHVLCEKPLAPTRALARTMLRAAERSGRVHAVGHLRRFFPAHRAAARLLGQGAIGQVLCATASLCTWPRPAFHDRAWSWLVRGERGGGVLGLYGTHYFDLLAWWLGEVEAVSCRIATALPLRTLPGSNRRRRVTSEDTAVCLLQFAAGVVATVTLSISTPQGAGSRIEMQGTHGRLLIEGEHRIWLARGSDRCALRPVPLPREDEAVPATPAELRPCSHLVRAFLAAVTERPGPTPAHPTFRDGARSVAVMEACRRSHAAGRWISLRGAPAARSSGHDILG